MSVQPQNRSVLLLPHKGEEQATDASTEQVTPIAAPSRPLLYDLLRPIRLDPRLLCENRIVTLDRNHPASASFDVLRTKLLRLARENAWTTIGVTAPEPQSGTTTVTLNLALSLSHQTDLRTLLLDLNLRNPGVARMLGDVQTATFADFLGGEGQLGGAVVNYGETLAIAAAAEPVQSAAEVLQARATAKRLDEIRLALEPDLVIVDAPPVLQRDDFEATLALYDAVLLVADTTRTLLADLDRCERELSKHTNVIGVVVNRCQFAR
ncbi:hypothetical protein [uncultured Paracoccus sp.]|uniref:hypothetical protein n=1 Tax=uncultured Paracoccus sp. TaxID=189685 RepID=UPI00261C4782|nr:hypothetical protein [uncultured Paracoccus sp.]